MKVQFFKSIFSISLRCLLLIMLFGALTATPARAAGLLYSIGNRVWFDTDNSGTINGVEMGVDGVTVNLYAANDLTTILDTQTTATGGYYLFNGLAAGDYVVSIAASNFSGAGLLKGYWSSSAFRTAAGASSETTAATANSDIDIDDNGTLQTSGALNGAVISSVVTLGPALSEPVSESDLDATLPGNQQGQPDAQANMTVDFGFYTVSLGDLVWSDADNSGLVNGESGIDGITVELWSGDGSAWLDATTTTGGGLYSFTGLAAGDYIVRLPAVNFGPGGILRNYHSSTGQIPALAYEPAPDADTDTTNSDDNGSEAGGLLGLGGSIQTLPVTLSPGAEQSSSPAMGATLESRVDFGVNNLPQIDLTATKTDNQAAYLASGTLTYTITVTNNGPADANGMTVSDPRPAQITSWAWTCAAGTPAGYNCTNDVSNPVTFTDTLDLPQLASVTYTVVAQVSPTAAGALTNAVSAIPPSGMTDITPRDNTAIDTDWPTPTVTINQAASQIDPATGSPLHFTAVFSDAVTGFTGKDISFSGTTVTGTLIATVSEIAPNNGTSYDVAITGMIPKGAVFVSIPAGAVESVAHPGVQNQASTSTDNSVVFDYVLLELGTASIASRDGWVLEATETSGAGGSLNNTAAALSVGDDASDRQYRSFVEFSTASLPDNAVIYTVNLRIIQAGIVGTNPFTTHGPLKADIKSGFYGSAAALQTMDFAAAADKVACSFEPVPAIKESLGPAYRCVFPSATFPFINRTGSTQMRIRFTLDDNDDLSPDLFNFYSGDFSNPTQRPRLFIKYYLPPVP